jgi:hypothetical protein
MNLSFLRRISTLPLATLIAAGTLLAAPPAPVPAAAMTDAARSALQRKASESLQETRALAAKLHRDADVLESLARSNQVSWQTHAIYLDLVKDHVNNMGEHLMWLRTMRHGVSPWQQQAIDRIYPVAVDLAGRTGAAISHLSQNRDRSKLYNPDYRDHLATITDRAEEVKTSVADFLKLGETQEDLARLQQKVEAAAS